MSLVVDSPAWCENSATVLEGAETPVLSVTTMSAGARSGAGIADDCSAASRKHSVALEGVCSLEHGLDPFRR